MATGRFYFDPAAGGTPAEKPSRVSPVRFGLLLLILAFALRLFAVMALRDIHKFHGPGPAGADAVEFNALALSLAAGHGYELPPGHPTSFRAPGFPFFLAAVYEWAPANYALVYLLLCLTGAATCVLTWLAAREVVNERAARAAGVLLALYFPHIYQATLFMSEDLFGLCTVSAVWLCLIYRRTGQTGWLAAAGLIFGYDALTRPIAVIMAGFVVLELLWSSRRSLRSVVLPVAGFALAAALVVLPWTWRNFTVFGKPVLIATNGGSTFYGANNDTALHDSKYKGLWISTVSLPGRNLIEATPDEVEHDRMEWKLGKEWVAGHWKDLPLLSVYKLARFVLPSLSSNNRGFVVVETVSYLPYLFLMGICAVRCGRALWHDSRWRVLHAIMGANLANVFIFSGDPRYRDAIAPILAVYAAAGLACAAGWFRRGGGAFKKAAPAAPAALT